MMNSLNSRWLVPALFGPLLAAWAFATITVLLGYCEPKWGCWGSWVVLMAVTTIVGGTQALTLVLIDVVLLRLRVRLLPTGARAWMMGLAAPLLVFLVYHLGWPGKVEGGPFWVLLFAPIVVSALGLRFAFAPRFPR